MKKNRRSIRLQEYDYSQAGAYFITICTHHRVCWFGDIQNEVILLNDTGRMITGWWEWLATQYDYIELDEYVVMPNHIHGIMVITEGGSRTAPTERFIPAKDLKETAVPVTTILDKERPVIPGSEMDSQRNGELNPELTTDGRGGSRTAHKDIPRKPVGRIIGAFKTVPTKSINEKQNTQGHMLWQRNYYEHVIRDDAELNQIRRYIIENPVHWNIDRENPSLFPPDYKENITK